MPARHENRSENRQRLMEIVEVVRRHEIIKGLTPEKLCAIIEELGPTFIKLGQILSMRSDILPKEYCEALKKLRSSVAPMPYEQVVSIVERSYGRPLGEVFSAFDEQALGSASIAQAHAAVLCSGESVVVKVQRDGIHDVMNRDILLLKRACKMLEYTPASGLVNFNQVLDEMWVVAQEEMNFLTEATNLERFRALNADVAFVTSPMLYREWTTTHVLVMERIDGVAIDDREALLAGGYDPAEIGAKLADGKIVWLDMGMMGTLTERERKLVGQAVSGVARGDVGLCRDAVLGLGEFRGKTDKRQLYRDIEGLLDQYGTADLGSMDLAKVFEDLTDVMKRNGISMPSSLTMLARGLATIEGVVADLSPEINVMNVVTARMGSQLLHSIDWRGEIVRDAQAVYASAHKSLEIPSLMADILRTGLKGEANLGVEHHVGNDMARLMQDAVLKLCAALVAAALLVCGALLRDVAPLAGGLSWLTVFCFLLSAALLGWAFVWKDQKK